MASQYIRLGQAYFTQGDNGSLNAVTDPETIRGLKGGQIPYQSQSTDRSLSFGQPTSLNEGSQLSPYFQQSSNSALNSGGTEPSASTSLNSGGDINSMFKSKFMEVMNGLQNSNLPALQARQKQIQTQQLTASMPDTSNLDPSGILKAVGDRGNEYAPALEEVTKAIAGEKTYGNEQLQTLSALNNLKKKDTQVVDVGGRRKVIDVQTGDTVRDLGPSPSGIGSGGNIQTDNERALMTTFINNPIVKAYNDIISQKNYTDNIIQNGIGGPADLALVYTFMKGLDPNSVVRESEYDMASKSGNIFAGAFAKYNGYLKPEGGFLPKSVQTQFQNLVNQKLKAQTLSYDNYARSMKEIATRQGLNPDNVVPKFELAVGNSGKLTSPDGKQEVTISDLTPAELKEAQSAGWK